MLADFSDVFFLLRLKLIVHTTESRGDYLGETLAQADPDGKLLDGRVGRGWYAGPDSAHVCAHLERCQLLLLPLLS